MTEPSDDQVLVDCWSLSPLDRAALQVFLERQPEVHSITRRLHIADALLNPDTQGLLIPCFDLVVHLASPRSPERAPSHEAAAAILKKIAEWEQANRPRADALNRDQ